jgi:hypothetical protein
MFRTLQNGMLVFPECRVSADRHSQSHGARKTDQDTLFAHVQRENHRGRGGM